MEGILVEGGRSRAFWWAGEVGTIYGYRWDEIVHC